MNTTTTTIDLPNLSTVDLPFDYQPVLSRLQRLALPPDMDPKNVIDTFVPRNQHVLDASPTSSVTSSNCNSAISNASHEAAFYATRSRVVRLNNLPSKAESVLAAMFMPHNLSEHGRVPVPATMWELRDEYLAGRRESVWAVFRTHEEAASALSLTGRPIPIAPALECDLEPFHKLRRLLLPNPASSSPAPTSSRHPSSIYHNNNNTLDLSLLPSLLSPSSSLPDLRAPSFSSMPPDLSSLSSPGDYTLSSNPPNPKTSFRLGDWICGSPNCAAHNFGRNLACIGCGCPRSNSGNGSGSHQHQPSANPSNARAQPSPRFNNNITYYSTGPSPSQTFQPQQHLQAPQQQQQHHHHQLQQPLSPQHPLQHQQQHFAVHQHAPASFSQPQPSSPFVSSPVSLPHVAHPPKSTHPLLTPSGRAFAIGGKVQNISSDPLNPCIMYWPDNEPFPEQGQIRPSNLAGVAQPPILNTGNRGPISHQPGDWICQKCNYLNWRRRKVCQTCLPYAEGNGDSISAAVQAERIALLTSVLSQNQLNGGSLNAPIAVNQAPRSHSLTPPQARRPFIDLSVPQPVTRLVHRSQSHLTLGQQYAAQQPQSAAPSHYAPSSPIYQTSGNRQPSPLYSTGPDVHRTNLNAHSNLNRNPGNANTNANAHAHAQNYVNTPSNSNLSINDFDLPSVSVHAPAPLLPSFLQDIVQSPALSPTSTTTSSADLSSIEEYEETTSPRSMFPRARGDSGSSDMHSPIANIWRLDGEESKSLTVFPLPTGQELVGRKISGEKLRT